MAPNKQVSARVPDEEMPIARGFIEAYKELPDSVKAELIEEFKSEDELGKYILQNFLASYKRNKTMKERNAKTASGAADSRINEVIDALIDWNNNSITDEDKVIIGSGIIQRLAGTNGNTVKRVLDKRLEEISKHYDEHGLNPNSRNSKTVLDKVLNELINRGIIEG